MILHGIEYQRPTSLNMRILADHVTYSFLAFMKSIFHFCLGCYCGGYSQNGRSNLSSCDWKYYVIYGGINTLRPRQNGRHFPDNIFKCIFLNENGRISIKISLKFVPKVPINNIPALVQIMAWRRPGDKPLSEQTMVTLLAHICVTRPQWVKQLTYLINSLVPRRSGWDFKNIIFNFVLLMSIFRSSYDNTRRWPPWDLTDDKSTSVQVMAWCRQARSHFLSLCWPRSMSLYGISRPQCVNIVQSVIGVYIDVLCLSTV